MNSRNNYLRIPRFYSLANLTYCLLLWAVFALPIGWGVGWSAGGAQLIQAKALSDRGVRVPAVITGVVFDEAQVGSANKGLYDYSYMGEVHHGRSALEPGGAFLRLGEAVSVLCLPEHPSISTMDLDAMYLSSIRILIVGFGFFLIITGFILGPISLDWLRMKHSREDKVTPAPVTSDGLGTLLVGFVVLGGCALLWNDIYFAERRNAEFLTRGISSSGVVKLESDHFNRNVMTGELDVTYDYLAAGRSYTGLAVISARSAPKIKDPMPIRYMAVDAWLSRSQYELDHFKPWSNSVPLLVIVPILVALEGGLVIAYARKRKGLPEGE